MVLLDIREQTRKVSFSHLYRSATKEASIGGDLYDVFKAKGGRIALLIGDVSGHGVEAAPIATLTKDVIQAFARQFGRPQLVRRKANALLVEKRTQWFVTVFLGFRDTETGLLTYSSAGHPNPLIRRRDGSVSSLQG